MSLSIDEWKERSLDRQSGSQRSHVETAKLLCTLGIASAATLVSTALQVGLNRGLAIAGTYFAALGFLLVIAALLLDRITVVDHDSLISDAVTRGSVEQEIVRALQIEYAISVRNNDSVVLNVRIASICSLLASAIAMALAALSVLT